MDNKNLIVAKIGKTVGLKGQLKLHIDTDFPEQFKKNSVFKTNKNQTLTIQTFNATSQLVKFVEINNIDEAKKYINSQLITTIDETKQNCKLKNNQYFWFDIQDCEIFENDIKIGIVKEIHRYPIDDYLEIKTSINLLNDNDKLAKSFLLPYNDNYILKVNIDLKRIDIINGIDILEAS